MKELTWKEAINKILEESSTPLHYKEITERVFLKGLRKKCSGDPSNTVNAKITTSIKNEGESSPYIRVGKGKGIYTLRERGYNMLTPDVSALDESKEQHEIITSFGMFWRKESIEWLKKSKLLGVIEMGDPPVDFYKQLGIYLLYDGREVIYVGRITERPLGRRLYEHTKDRMSARWDRFSWFGLLPVSNDGSLGSLPTSYNATQLIPALEAILIEALEPRQNRKRGDDFVAVEYIQKIDPEIEKKKAVRTINEWKSS